MGITITPLSPERLGVTGDAVLELPVPFDGDEERFHLALSDGTVIVGEYEPDEDAFHYQVETLGRSTVSITGGVLSIDPTPDWIKLALYDPDGQTVTASVSIPLRSAPDPFSASVASA